MRDLGPRDAARSPRYLFQVSAKPTAAPPPPAAVPAARANHLPVAYVAGAGAAAALVAALGGAGFLRTERGKSAAEDFREAFSLATRQAQMKIQAEVADAFGAATGEKNSFPIINRYAESVTSRYDIGVLPDALEVRAYAEVIKSAAMGGFRGLYQNVRSADVLGHPVTLTNEVKWDHVPPIPDVDARDVEAFVEDVLDEENEKTGLLPRDVEMEIYRNAFITGIYVMEDTLKSLRIRLFRTEYGFEIAPSAAGWRCTQKPPPLTDQQLVRLMREELKAPAITRLFPTVERNVARVAAALAGEVVGSTEFLFLGLPLRFELRAPAPPKVDDSKVPSLEDMARKKRREKRKKREAAKASAETTALIENYVDGYLASQRSGGGPLDGGLFFSRKLERDTYVGFLSQMIGNVEGSTIANVMGFDVVLRVGRAGRDAEGKLKLPEITFARASRAEREAIEQFVDWVMADPVYNIKAVPDVIERQIYINVFELTSTLLASGLSTFELELLGRNITMRGAEARVEDAPSVATSERFKPNPEMLRRFAAETTDVEAVQEVMCNVYAFVLAFVAFEMQGIETTIVGRRLRFGLGQPEERLEDLPRIETEFNANLRRALALLVSEMIEAAVAGGESGGAKDAGLGGAEALTGAAKKGFLGFVRGGFEKLGVGAKLKELGFLKEGSALAPRDDPSNKPVDVEAAIYDTFVKNKSNADDAFPFPYLNQAQFDAAVTDLVKALRPGKMVPKKAVSEVAAAADVNGDGVIQWAEYYFAAKELDEIFAKADEAAKAKAAEGGAR